MGSCLSAPDNDQRRAAADTANVQTTSSRRQERGARERTSLERRNAEARDQLLAGRGGMQLNKCIMMKTNSIKRLPSSANMAHGSPILL